MIHFALGFGGTQRRSRTAPLQRPCRTGRPGNTGLNSPIPRHHAEAVRYRRHRPRGNGESMLSTPGRGGCSRLCPRPGRNRLPVGTAAKASGVLHVAMQGPGGAASPARRRGLAATHHAASLPGTSRPGPRRPDPVGQYVAQDTHRSDLVRALLETAIRGHGRPSSGTAGPEPGSMPPGAHARTLRGRAAGGAHRLVGFADGAPARSGAGAASLVGEGRGVPGAEAGRCLR